MPDLHVSKPSDTEYASYFGRYVDLVPDGEILVTLAGQISGTLATLRGVSDAGSLKRYAEGKWSIREVVGHMIDTERIFAYRALRIARNDQTNLPGFEQDDYAAVAGHEAVALTQLVDEFAALRASHLHMFEHFDEPDNLDNLDKADHLCARGTGRARRQ